MQKRTSPAKRKPGCPTSFRATLRQKNPGHHDRPDRHHAMTARSDDQPGIRACHPRHFIHASPSPEWPIRTLLTATLPHPPEHRYGPRCRSSHELQGSDRDLAGNPFIYWGNLHSGESPRLLRSVVHITWLPLRWLLNDTPKHLQTCQCSQAGPSSQARMLLCDGR